jgi:hypothetical protein
MSVRDDAVAAWLLYSANQWLPHLDPDLSGWAPVTLGAMQTGHQQLYTIQQHRAFQGRQE